MPQERVFTVGLTMAGAVSAGAYNAGVFDFLIQALEEWERARIADAPGIPNHRVAIPVISGTSAGGVVAALGALALNGAPALPPSGAAGERHVLPELHAAWVERISLLPDKPGADCLLGTRDLADGRLVSLLDASVIDTVADDILAGIGMAASPRPYLTQPLHLFLTLTNLRGVPLFVPFGGSTASDGHYMAMHADRAHFSWDGLGTAPFDSRWLAQYRDHGAPTDIATLKRDGAAWRRFKAATLGTAAFPVGLPGRLIEAHGDEYATRAWHYPNPEGARPILPRWPVNAQGATSYSVPYAAADGGIIDNEPFEIARWTIMETPGEPNPSRADKADRAVLMVDPFPEGPAFDPDLDEDDLADQLLLRAVAMALLPALKNQARVKALDLTRAADGRVYSRFLIAPERMTGPADRRAAARYPLACGTFAAFGGFLARAFRSHDYQLGRRNAQRFLQRWFTLHESNPLFADWPAAARSDPRFRTDGPDPTAGGGVAAAATYHTVIPLLGSAAETVPAPDWPVATAAEIDEFARLVRARADALVAALRADQGSRVTRLAIRVGWQMKGGGVVAAICRLLEADLIRRDLHADWRGRLDSDLERGIVATLAALGDDAWRTVEAIAHAVNRERLTTAGAPAIDTAAVQAALQSARIAPLLAEGPRHAGQPSYALKANLPSAWKRLPVVRNVLGWLSRPDVA